MTAARPFRITFVCSGNTCRSPMAEAIARDAAARMKLDWLEVASAGTSAWPGAPASEGARRAAASSGLDLESHRSAPLTEETVAASDLLLCMGAAHLERVRELGGAASGWLLTEMAGGRGEVEDPFGAPDEVYEAAFAMLRRLVETTLRAQGAEPPAQPEPAGQPKPKPAVQPGPSLPEPSLYALLGDPVKHSLSPRMHNAAFRAAGRSACYELRQISEAECGPELRALALAGGGGNVTVPHKERVLPFLQRRTGAVAATGACNTFWAEDGEVWGDNTDVAGFAAAWRAAAADLDPAPEVLVLGAGGAARAVVYALLNLADASRILLWNRTPARAEALALHFSDDRIRPVRRRAGLAADALVNATSVGLHGRSSPVELDSLASPPRFVVDLVYNRERPTPLCRQAADLDIPAADGLEMLVRQAEASYRRWFGEPPPRGVMSRALR